MRWGLVLVLVSSFACVSYRRVSIAPGNPAGDDCLQVCKQTHHSDDAVVECASRCPGALVQNDDCARRTNIDGEPEVVTGCVVTEHVKWDRIAEVAVVIVGSAVAVTAFLVLGYLSTPTH